MDFKKEIKEWAIRTNQSAVHTNHLLKILRSAGHSVPKDSGSLKNTPRQLNIIQKENGKFLKIGFNRNLQHFCSTTNFEGDTLMIDLGIDGVLLYSNSKLDCWPILFRVVGSRDVYVFGIYAGIGKPKNSEELMREYVNEYLEYNTKGFQFNGRQIKIISRAYILDSPGKSLLLEIKYFNGYSSCPRCRILGISIDRRMSFVGLNFESRTDTEFRHRIDPKHHRNQQKIPIEELNVDCVKDFVCDSMHACFLGVVKFQLKGFILVKGKPYSFSKKQIEDLNKLIDNIEWPREFGRHLRNMNYINIFKATELKNFLFYVGIALLKDFLDPVRYEHFLKLALAMRILWDQKDCLHNINCAENLIDSFVTDFENLYSAQDVGFNVHLLTHLCEDVKYFNCDLSVLNAFIFENKNMEFKRLLKSGNGCLEQLGKRIIEKLSIFQKRDIPNQTIPTVINTRSSAALKFENYTLTDSGADKYCLIEGKVFEVSNIYKNDSNKFFVKGSFINNFHQHFASPIESKMLQIFESDILYERGVTKIFGTEKIRGKFFKINTGSNSIFIKMVHSFYD